MLSFISGDALFWLKVLSFGITNVLALLGLLYDFKNKLTGRLTPWGRVNLAGIIVSFVVGISAQGIENHKSTEKAKEDAETAQAAAASMASLLQKNQALIEGNKNLMEGDQAIMGNVGTLLKKNEVLLGTTGKSLIAERKIDAETQLTLQSVARNLEPAGDTIRVKYYFQKILDDGAYQQDIKRIQEYLDNFKVGQTYPADDSEVLFNDHRKPDVIFGRKSTLFPTGRLQYAIDHPPFKIRFSKARPDYPGWSRKEQPAKGQVLTPDEFIYLYDEQSIHEEVTHTSYQLKFGVEPFEWRFINSSKVISQRPSTEVVFKRLGDPGQMLSALDFGGMYMSVDSGAISVKFCQFEVRIGPRRIYVPLNDVSEDGKGSFTFKLPDSMTQTAEEVERVGKETAERCPDELGYMR